MRCKPPGPSIRLSAYFLWAVCAGCENDIALGSECPPFGVDCIERIPRGDGDQGGSDSGSDAGLATPDAGSLAADAGDGQVDLPDGGGIVAPTSRFPAFKNGSFDITSGSKSGGVLSYYVVQTSPWLSCNAPGLGPGVYPTADLRTNNPIGTPLPGDTLAPTHGLSLINISPDGTTLAEELGEPLMAGQRYAFMIDIASTQGSTDLSLEMQGSNGSSQSATLCLGPQPIVATVPALPGVWTSVCVAFTPMKDYRSILFSASSTSAASGSRLFIDHIRADPGCY